MVILADPARRSSPATLPSSSTIPVNTAPSSLLQAPGDAKDAQDTTVRPRRTRPRRVLPPIRTFTVGTGIPPVQPADGLGRVADCHRRFGVSPTPEHA